MSLILNIDTSTENASISISEDGKCLCELTNSNQKEHAAWLHPALQQAFQNCGKSINDLRAVGITVGPGSYTGLRIGMATAKGLCYALNLPLIGVNTLEAMACAALEEEADYICPMIDARRMEVYTALYDKQLTPLIDPCALILEKTSFLSYLNDKKIVFFGSGKNKLEEMMMHPNAIFKNIIFNPPCFSALIYRNFVKSEFEQLSSAKPLYLKEFR